MGTDTLANVHVQAASAALGRGEPVEAARHFQTAIQGGLDDPAVWIGLATARRGAGDLAGAGEALDAALKRDPQNMIALIHRGDLFVALGDGRAAMAFYNQALRTAEQYEGLPAPLLAEINRAREACQKQSDKFYGHLAAELGRAGYDAASSSARFTHSLELLTGQKTPYLQKPRAHFFPELPQKQFYARDEFPWFDRLEAAVEDICGELQALIDSGSAEFSPYIQASPDRPVDHSMALLDSDDWSSCYLVRNGEPVEAVVARCPKTMAALEDVPLAQIKGRTPSILFSRLLPGAKIPPHHGFINSRLICHLPLIVPPGCKLRVGNDVREWERGKGWVFDDTIEHEAWNGSDASRIILIFDIWRPELTDEECQLVAALMEAVDGYESGAVR
ncbi:aspartyl/asparaginyl beta-hydroxylase domain-containing protein [Maricaulis sp.]|uniref:aspartyl/asparaginyl beta-hydroxylase domain-containing protein n=1 Tax=Maricaulis sp. TaxID=1486257 RepID=UPI0025C2D6FC|nr:aspartyl/asparaginyl beta-hydroxylase domain-containing protein [Maricaulis sp.]